MSSRIESPAPAEARPAAPRSAARRAILDATEALMIEAGGDTFSMRRLAARCGYTAPTIYHHFGDKDGLVDALLEERFARLLARVRRVGAGADPLDYLRRMVHAFVRFGLQNPAFYRLLLTGSSKRRDRTPPSAEAAREMLQAPLAELESRGRLRGTDPETGAQALWSLMHGLVALQISRPDHAWSRRLAEVAVNALLDGLVAPD